MLALNILQTSQNVKERASDYAIRIKRNLQRSIIEALIIKKEKIEDKIKSLKDIQLETNINNGHQQMTIEQCEKRFEEIIECEFQMEMLQKEIDIKNKSFDQYFK